MCGEAKDGEEILREKPFEMGETLKVTSKLDVNAEMNLLEEKIGELRAINADETTFKYAMKDYGTERFFKFFMCSFLFFIVLYLTLLL